MKHVRTDQLISIQRMRVPRIASKQQRIHQPLYMIKIPTRAHFGLKFENVIKIFLAIKSSGFSLTTPLQIKVFGSYSVKTYAYEFETSIQLEPYLAYTRLWPHFDLENDILSPNQDEAFFVDSMLFFETEYDMLVLPGRSSQTSNS